MRGSRPGVFCLALPFLPFAAPVAAQAPAGSSEDRIRATVERWYEELAKRNEGRLWNLVAPGFIEASPPRT
jgi:hypothetical protein